MAVSWIAAYRGFLLLSIAVGLFLLHRAALGWDKQGAKPLLVLLTGALLYVCVKLVVSFVRGTPAVFVITRFNPIGAGLATVGFFLLVIEYTGVENPVSKRTATELLLVPAVASALVWIDLEYLWIPVSADTGALSGYAWELTSVAIANQMYMNLLLLVGLGLLIRPGVRSRNVFRMQAVALILAALGPLLGNLAFQFGYLPFNFAPVMFVVSGALIAWAVLRAGFLNMIPIGHDTVLDQFDASVLTLDADHRVIDINESGRRLFDVEDPDTLVGDHVDSLFADLPLFGEAYWATTASDSEQEQDTLVESNGQYYDLEVTPIKPTEETFLGRSVIVRDVTQQKRREQEIRKLNTRFELALEETETGVWEWSLGTDRIIWDDTSERLFGYESGTFPGTFEGLADRVPDEDLDAIRQQVNTAIETGREFRADFRVELPDDRKRWVQARGVVESNGSGEPLRLLGIQTDITEQKKREREIEQAREKLRQIIDLIPDPLYAKNLDDEVLLSNEANAELHGMNPEQIERKRERNIEADVENIENFDKYRRRELEVAEKGEPMTFEEELVGPDGEKRVFQTTRIPFKPDNGDENMVLGYARDVTGLKQYERELEESNERLEQFASIVSHDLRNPLHVADGTLELVEDTGDLARIADVREQLERMETMIEDLLTLARVGQSVEETERVALKEVVSEAWNHADVDGCELESPVPADASVNADRDRLLHVFENLFRNTADHNELPLTVRVGLLHRETAATDSKRSGFFIEDDGTGIPEEQRDEVFEHGYTTDTDGTGFGLSIVQDVVEAHGWDIHLSERGDGGARFEITTNSN